MQEFILQQSLLISVGALLFGLLFGLLLGRRSEQNKLQGRIDEAQRKAEAQAKVEKANLATDLHVELDKVKESIIKSAEAYQQAVYSIDSKLSPDASQKEAIDISVRANLEAPLDVAEPIDKQTAPLSTSADDSATEKSNSVNGTTGKTDTGDECPSESETLRMSKDALEEKAHSEPSDESDTLEHEAINDSDENTLKKRA